MSGPIRDLLARFGIEQPSPGAGGGPVNRIVDLTREEKMAKAGFKQLDMPKGVALVAMRGGNTLVQPNPGDDVEVYIDVKGKGAWQGGYVALSGVEAGEMGGPYDGKDVVWIGRAEDQEYDSGEVHGQEWPAEFLRLAAGNKPTYQDQQDEQPDGIDFSDTGAFLAASLGPPVQILDMGANTGIVQSFVYFFRPDQLRGYHGKWVSEGKGNLRSRRPMGEALPDAVTRETEAQYAAGVANLASMINPLTKKGYTPDDLVTNLLAVFDQATPEQVRMDSSWYYEVHDMAWEWARHYDIRPEIVAAVIASLSPQVAWGEGGYRPAPASAPKALRNVPVPTNSPKKFLTTNQGLAWKVLRLVYEQGDRVIDITPEVVRAATAAVTKLYQIINYESYSGKDNGNGYEGKSFMGPHRIKDLPADILIQVLPKETSAMMQEMGTAAIRLARGHHPDALRGFTESSNKWNTNLNGPKVRSFYNNIINPDASTDSTSDVHMYRAMTNLDVTSQQGSDMTGKPGRYLVLHQALLKAAALRGLKPHEFQAAVWLEWRRLHPPDEKAKISKAQGVH